MLSKLVLTFDAFASEQVYGIDVYIGAGTPTEPLFMVKLYEFDAGAGDFVYLDETAEYICTQRLLATAKSLYLCLHSLH